MKKQAFSIISLLCCFLFLFSAGTSNAAKKPEKLTTLNGLKITFKGVTYQDDNDTSTHTSTWVYEVEDVLGHQKLSKWVLGIPECAHVVSADPLPSGINSANPNSGINGIEWDIDSGFTKETFTIVLEGKWKVGTTNLAAKGPNWARGEIAGPVCQDISEDTVGGSDDEDQVSVIIDTKHTKKVKYKFKQAVKQGKAGKRAKIFLLLKVSGEPLLEPYIFARPSDSYLEREPEGSYVRVALANGKAAFNFTELFLVSQVLSTDAEDLDFDLGDLSGLKGLNIFLVSAYLVDRTGEFDIIQEVKIEVK